MAVKKKSPTKKAVATVKKKAIKSALKTVDLGGRPTRYRAEYAEQARKLCLLGFTDAGLADVFGVAESTINNWKLKFPKFSESLWRGKQIADAEVASGLYQRACGYQHPDTHISVVDKKIVKTPITKQYPPDTGAATMWLKNRQPDKWRDSVDLNHGGNADNPLVILARAVQGAALPIKEE